MKKKLHPKWFLTTPVYCNGHLVKIVNSTQCSIKVDIWSGTHPFFTNSLKNLDIKGTIDTFLKKYKQ